MNKTVLKFFAFFITLTFSFQSQAQCEIFEVVADPTECFDDGTFDVVLNFSFQNVGNEGFKVQGNGVHYGDFSYDNLPVVLEGLEGNGTTPYEFVVIDLQHPDCQNWTELGTIDCSGGSGGTCEIFELWVEHTDCDNEGNFMVFLGFEFANVGDEGFNVTGNGNDYGNFSYDNLPIELGPFSGDGTTFYEFAVTDAQHPDCHAGYELGIIDCSTTDCDIFDLVADPIECNPDGTYSLAVNFFYENPSNEFFDLYNGDDFIGFYALDELPITIESFAPSGNAYDQVTVCINDNPNCCETIDFAALDCSGGGTCEIWDVIAEAHECDDSNHFMVDIDFNFNNVGNTGYTVHGNGTNYGTFSYDEPYITIGPLLGDGTTVYEFIITDVDHPDCSDHTSLGPINCEGGDCEIWDLVVEAGECFDDDTYHLWIDFNYSNAPNSLFEVYNDGSIIGTYALADLPVMIENFPSNGNPEQGILVCINDTPGCCEDIGFANPCYDGGGNDCHIWDVIAEAHECDDSGGFLVDVAFNFDGVGDEGFSVVGNGNNYGSFSYDEPYVTIGPIEGNGEVYEIIVVDNEFEYCNAHTSIGPIFCDEDCHIYNVHAELHECDDDGLFYVDITFDYQNVGDDGFSILGNGNNYGSFGYDVTVVTLGPFEGSGMGVMEFGVVDNQFEDCHGFTEIEVPDCFGTGDCHIIEMAVDLTECNPDGTYGLWINFQVVNSPNEFFDLYAGDVFLGFYLIDELPILIENFPTNGGLYDQVTVCINDAPDCCSTLDFEALDCQANNLVWPGDANNDNIADNYDLLNIGLAFNDEGPARGIQGVEWHGVPSPDWEPTFQDGTNYKHANCNGDHIINAGDVEAILVNFGETHGDVLPFEGILGSENDPPLYVDLPDPDDIQMGVSWEAPIIFGEEDIPVGDVYGLAFSLVFDPEFVIASSIDIVYQDGWMGTPGVNLMAIDKTLADDGIVKVAITKTDHNNVSGFGQIAKFIGIIDNIAGKEEIYVEVTDVMGIMHNEEEIPIFTPVEVIEVVVNTTEPNENNLVQIFPNPTSSVLYIQNQQQLPIESVEIRNASGQAVDTLLPISNQISLENYAAGVYFLKIKIGERFYFEKLVVN